MSLFKEEFWNEFERQKISDEKIDFTGFVFPIFFQFNHMSFLKSVIFDAALFPGLIDFSGCRFAGPVTSFSGTIFLGITSFLSASFLGESVDFNGTYFINNSTSFHSAKFAARNICFYMINSLKNPPPELFGVEFPSFTEWKASSHEDASFVNQIMGGSSEPGLSFNHAIFDGELIFSDSTFSNGVLSFNSSVFSSNLNFFDSRVDLDSFSIVNSKILKDVDFNFPKLCVQKLNFSGSTFIGKVVFDLNEFYFQNINLFNSNFSNVTGLEKFVEKSKILKKARYKFKDFRFFLGPESAARYPILDRKTKDAWFLNEFKAQHPFIYKIWKLSSNCGQSILRWSLFSFVIATIFSIFYGMIGPSGFDMKHKSWFSYLYYSIVTFTTLGFGDITPRLWYTEMLVTIEVIFGYIMLGGLISIFSNKLARRS